MRPGAFVSSVAAAVIVVLLAAPAPARAQEERCECIDVDPRSKEEGWSEVTCWQVYLAGDCERDWIFSTLKEISEEGYCQITCGRCDCCPRLGGVALAQGLDEFLWAAEAAGPNVWNLVNSPGYYRTFLIPTNAAFRAGLAAMGYPSREAAAQAPEVLEQVILQHILLPNSYYNAVWTTPFLRNNLWTPTEVGGSGVIWERSDDDESVLRVRTQAASTAQATVDPEVMDIELCKGYLTVIDGFLTPPSTALSAAPAESG